MCAEGAVGQHCIGGQEAELKAGSEVNMDEEGTGPPTLLSLTLVVSRILFYTGCCVCASVRTVSQLNGFVALNDWQQQQRLRLSDVGVAVGGLLRPRVSFAQ